MARFSCRFSCRFKCGAIFLSLLLTLQMLCIFLVASLDISNRTQFTRSNEEGGIYKLNIFRYILVSTSYRFVSWHFSRRFKCGAIFLSLLLTLQMLCIFLVASLDISNRTQSTRSNEEGGIYKLNIFRYILVSTSYRFVSWHFS